MRLPLAALPSRCPAQPGKTTIKDCYPDEYFLRSSLFRGRLFKGSESEDPDNTLVAPAIRTAELVARAYYIGTSSNTSACPADGAVPSLFRVELSSSGGLTAEEVAYGVDNLQIKYGVDSSGDGIVNRYYDGDDIDSTDASQTELGRCCRHTHLAAGPGRVPRDRLHQ